MRARGFSLMEVIIIVICIAGLIAAVLVPLLGDSKPPQASVTEAARLAPSSGSRRVEMVKLQDGTQCAVAHAPDAISITCDWGRR